MQGAEEEEEEEWGAAEEALLEEEARLADLYDSPIAVPHKPHGMTAHPSSAAGASRDANRDSKGEVVVLDDDSEEEGELQIAAGFVAAEEEQDGMQGEQNELDKVSRAGGPAGELLRESLARS